MRIMHEKNEPHYETTTTNDTSVRLAYACRTNCPASNPITVLEFALKRCFASEMSHGMWYGGIAQPADVGYDDDSKHGEVKPCNYTLSGYIAYSGERVKSKAP